MTIDITSALPISNAAAAGAPVQAGYGVSLGDFAGFESAMARVDARLGARLEARPVSQPSQAAQQLMRPFEHINGQATQLAQDASVARAAGQDMTPGEIVNLTVRCQEFMFQCQLTSNIANRTSDGLAQLFRQQS
jgi:hypothetical protein